jgi:biopolymer transport protein ExbD
MEFERKRYEHTHINIAPLVDVIFQLLLFFMLTSHLIQEPGIKVHLPESKTADSPREEIKTIFITKDRRIYFMEKTIDINTLSTQIKSLIKDPEHDFVRIKADREADVGILVSVIDEVRIAGIKNYSIVTERK